MPGVILRSDPRARMKPCVRCGYSLRYLTDARNCPECGLAVRISLNENRSLEWGNPRWLRVLAWGAWCLMAEQILRILLQTIYILNVWTGYRWSDAVSKVLFLVSQTLRPLQLAACGLGLFLLSCHERRYPEKTRTLRLTVRVVGLTGGLLALPMVLMSIVYGDSSWGTRSPIYPYLYVWVINATWSVLLCNALAWIYLRKLWQRTYARWPAKVCNYMMAALAVYVVTRWALVPWRVAWWRWTFLSSGCAYHLLAAATLAWFALLLRRIAREAEWNWVTDP